MSELVAKVADAILTADESEAQASSTRLSRAAIAAVFDWLAVPMKEAVEAGVTAAEDCLDSDWDSGPDGESHNSYSYLRSDAPQTIFAAMLAEMRRAALG